MLRSLPSLNQLPTKIRCVMSSPARSAMRRRLRRLKQSPRYSRMTDSMRPAGCRNHIALSAPGRHSLSSDQFRRTGRSAPIVERVRRSVDKSTRRHCPAKGANSMGQVAQPRCVRIHTITKSPGRYRGSGGRPSRVSFTCCHRLVGGVQVTPGPRCPVYCAMVIPFRAHPPRVRTSEFGTALGRGCYQHSTISQEANQSRFYSAVWPHRFWS